MNAFSRSLALGAVLSAGSASHPLPANDAPAQTAIVVQRKAGQ